MFEKRCLSEIGETDMRSSRRLGIAGDIIKDSRDITPDDRIGVKKEMSV